MAMHGGHGRHGGHGMHGRPGRMGGHRGHGMHGRPMGRMPHPAPMIGFGGMMGFGWLLAPFMGMVFITMFFGAMIGSTSNFSTIFGLLCMLGAVVLLYQMRSQGKSKRKRKTYDSEYYSDAYDDTIE